MLFFGLLGDYAGFGGFCNCQFCGSGFSRDYYGNSYLVRRVAILVINALVKRLWPFSCSVVHAQNLNLVILYAIRHDIWQVMYD